MPQHQIRRLPFAVLSAMLMAFQLVNARHIYFAVKPYHHEFAPAVTAAFIFIPVAVILATTFRAAAQSRLIDRILFLVAAGCFLGELLANLFVAAWEADRDNARIVEMACLFGLPYKVMLFSGAATYSMAISGMVAGLVFALAPIAQEMLGIAPPGPTPYDQAPSPPAARPLTPMDGSEEYFAAGGRNGYGGRE